MRPYKMQAQMYRFREDISCLDQKRFACICSTCASSLNIAIHSLQMTDAFYECSPFLILQRFCMTLCDSCSGWCVTSALVPFKYCSHVPTTALPPLHCVIIEIFCALPLTPLTWVMGLRQTRKHLKKRVLILGL